MFEDLLAIISSLVEIAAMLVMILLVVIATGLMFFAKGIEWEEQARRDRAAYLSGTGRFSPVP